MAVFDQLQPASFGGLKFPVREVRISGSLRDHVHEFPHAPGGAPEKLGRGLYRISMTAAFLGKDATLAPAYRKWNPLWPNTLRALREYYENGDTQDLHIPTIGTIQAYIKDWGQTMTNSNRSGEVGDFLFVEDQESAFLVNNLLEVRATSLADKADAWNVQIKGVDDSTGLFDAITEAANSVLAIKDQIDLYGALVESKILGLTGLLREADEQVRSLNDPTNYQVLDALHELWDSALKLHKDLQERGAQLRNYVTPMLMPLSKAAAAIYGDSARTSELLQLNALEDPFAVPPGTTLRYYDVAA